MVVIGVIIIILLFWNIERITNNTHSTNLLLRDLNNKLDNVMQPILEDINSKFDDMKDIKCEK